MGKIKEIKILEPKIKEVKKEKPKEEKIDDEDDDLEEDLEQSVEITKEEARTDLKKLILESEENTEKSLEQKISGVITNKTGPEKKFGQESPYEGTSSLYSDAKHLYSGSGDEKSSGYDSEGLKSQNNEIGTGPYKSVIEERRDSGPFDQSQDLRKRPHRR